MSEEIKKDITPDGKGQPEEAVALPEEASAGEAESENTETSRPPEGMSIFDKQEKNYKAPKKKMKPWILPLVAVVLCVGIGFGAWGVVKVLDKTDTGDTSSGTSSSDFSITLLDFSGYSDTMDEVAELGRGGVENITLKNSGGELVFEQGLSETVTTDANGSQSTKKTVGWSITNYENINWDSSAVSGLVSNALTVTALMKMADNVTDLSQYGLAPAESEDPVSEETATVTVTFGDESSYTVHLGDWSPDNSGRYFTVEGESFPRNTVYLSSYSLGEYAGQTMEDFVSLSALAAYQSNGKDSEFYSDGTLLGFSEIIMSGRKFDGNFISFSMADQTVTYTYYKMNILSLNSKGKYEELLETPTNDDRVYEVFDLVVSGFSADKVYKFYPTEDDRADYGLDTNYVYVLYVIGDVKYRIEVGDKQEDGLYPVMINENQVIYGVSADALSFLKYGYVDYYRDLLYLCNINEMSKVRVQTADYDYSFDIKQIPKEGDSESYDQEVTLKGKTVDITTFRRFLSNFMQFTALGHTDEVLEDVGKADVTITISYVNEELEDDVITLYKYSDRRYLYRTNGTGDSLVKLDSLNTVLDYAVNAAKSAS